MYYHRYLYIFFILLALNLSFFSTSKLNAKGFFIDEIEIQEKLENNFNKETLINKGFKKAFYELMSKLIQSKDLIKIKNANLNEIKSMIETFTIKKEKFVDKTYSLNLGVSFNKKKILNYLNNKKIFPSQIREENFLFIPILLDQSKNDILVYSNNPFYTNWKVSINKSHLIKYVLPTEDLEDLNLIRKNYLEIENYDFKKIIQKYSLENSIVAIFFKNESKIKILSKIRTKENQVIKSFSFDNIDLNNIDELTKLINNLKINYEDFWKVNNLINTSIKLPILIQVDTKNFGLSLEFEETLNKMDLINSFSISRFDKDFIFYELIFNGTPKYFINTMREQNFNFDTQNKIWILK
ncbi:hypothetical protein IDH33_01335 [Pelagibacterales bacterium SAG-MED43]|nr:hypothetical protein [Pelagibacterales bacterium SAG-MED43]